MKNLIRADLERILRKKSFIVMIIIVLVFSSASLFTFMVTKVSAAAFVELMKTSIFSPSLVSFLIGLPIFLAVYADEISSSSMQAIIGRGVSRTQIIFAKIIDCIILTALIYALLSVLVFVSEALLAAGLSPEQKLQLAAGICIEVLRSVGISVMAMAVLFITGNIALGVIADVCFLLILYVLFQTFQTFTGVPVYDYSFTGLMEAANDQIVAGAFPSQLLIALVLYCGIALAVVIPVFRRKELEF